MPRSPASKKGWLAHYSELIGIWRGKRHADGEDAIQDAVLGMLERSVGTIKDTRAYLSRSASNALVDIYRKRSILDMNCLDTVPEDTLPRVEDAQGAIYARELMEGLREALQALPPDCQKVYLLHRIEEWSHAEIAAEMGISRSMVEKHMNRALLHLHEKLQKYSPY